MLPKHPLQGFDDTRHNRDTYQNLDMRLPPSILMTEKGGRSETSDSVSEINHSHEGHRRQRKEHHSPDPFNMGFSTMATAK